MGNTNMNLKILLTACFTIAATTAKLRKNKLVYQIAMKEIGSCWVEKCQDGCYTTECLTCKTECRSNLPENPVWAGRPVSSRKFCNLTCKSQKICPKWKTEACTTCVTQNCAGELFKDETELKN